MKYYKLYPGFGEVVVYWRYTGIRLSVIYHARSSTVLCTNVDWERSRCCLHILIPLHLAAYYITIL